KSSADFFAIHVEFFNLQKLLTLHPPLFSPDSLTVNESGTLLALAGPNGVLVVQLPPRCPPYGAFESNKELIYCRSYSLDERLLTCNDTIQVRRVKFHPGSITDTHILVLTSDNTLRLYQIENNEAFSVGTYPIGESPGGLFPGSKISFLDIYGEIAVDFDFGFPEIVEEAAIWESLKKMNISQSEKGDRFKNGFKSKYGTKVTAKPYEKPQNNTNADQLKELVWPVYILRGDFSVFSINIDLKKRIRAVLRGPFPTSQLPSMVENEACSIIALKTVPEMLCIAGSNGILTHGVLLNIDETEQEQLKAKSPANAPEKELLVFETVELELGLTIAQESEHEELVKYKCPIFLRKDDSKASRYFATHSAGVHTINLNCVDDLHSFVFGPEDAKPSSDIFMHPTSAEYLVCTKVLNSEKSNTVIGFALYYEPTSIIAILSDGSVVTLGILAETIAPKDQSMIKSELEDSQICSPLKKMLNEPFDQYIQKILKKGSSRPLLKISTSSNHPPEECFDLLQRAAAMFREEHVKNLGKAKEELEKRMHTLRLLKQAQKQQIEEMNVTKDELREKAENLAEKYEDINDKQEMLLKKCENLIMLVSRKRTEPSDAESKFLRDLEEYNNRCASFQTVIDKVKNKTKYQQIQIQNWKSRENKKIPAIGEMQANTIKESVRESTSKINEMVKQVNEYKALLSLK
ncbi:nuclear pore complex protein Nup88, partial [Dendroctonus ponderosae]